MEAANTPRVAADPGPLCGELVCFTGRLASMTRPEAEELVRSFGGEFTRTVTGETTLLVIGEEGWPLKKDGRLTGNLTRAKRLGLLTTSEGEFLERLGLQELGDSICRRYTLTQLSRMLGVRRDRIRSWKRAGLVGPVESRGPVDYFDFRQAALVKTLCELAEAGVSTSLLRHSLQQLRSWMPDATEALNRLTLLDGRHLAVDSLDGQLSEPHGQLLIEFEQQQHSTPVRYERPTTPDGLFAIAVEQEDAGHYQEAAASYRQWLAAYGPDPEVSFNLGNVLTELGQSAAAIERYRQSVELDPDYLEAWHNLARVLAEVGWFEEALQACRRAIAISPTNGDTHYMAADVLDQMGDVLEARRHWREYLKYDSVSEYADYARDRLGSSA
jgi:tetratricopeptide (TPR) repeat protein